MTQTPLTILQVVTATTFAGIERHVLALSEALTVRGHRVVLACPRAADRLRTDAASRGLRIRPAADANGTWFKSFTGELRRDGFDVVHVHDGHGALAGPAIAAFAGAALVRTQHFTLPASSHRGGFRGRSSLVAHRALNARVDAYLAVSESVRDGALQRRETTGPIEVIPPAVDLPLADAVKFARSGRAVVPPTVVFAGRHEAERRLDLLLHAVPAVLARVPDAQFVLAGDGACNDALRRLADSLGIVDRVTWPGWVDDPYELYAAAHVYANTWDGEAFGMSVAEAMALELPVVAVDAGANPELVVDGQTGYLVPPGDAQAISRALINVLSDLPRTARMGAAARRRTVARCGTAVTTDLTIELYRRVVGGRQ